MGREGGDYEHLGVLEDRLVVEVGCVDPAIPVREAESGCKARGKQLQQRRKGAGPLAAHRLHPHDP